LAGDAERPADTGSADATATGCPELADTDPWEDRLGAHTLADRGVILGCAHVATYTQSDVASSSNFFPCVGVATNGYELFVVQYVSEGRSGVASAVTALLYLPSGGTTDLPIAAVDHGLFGIGPSCGPTHDPTITDSLAVPLVGRGYAAVATDYAGVGVDTGMTSFLVGTAEAAASIDGVRALLQFHDSRFDAAQLGMDFFVVGHSQGGHASLFTHQLSPSQRDSTTPRVVLEREAANALSTTRVARTARYATCALTT
jgi:hypothetical protein